MRRRWWWWWWWWRRRWRRRRRALVRGDDDGHSDIRVGALLILQEERAISGQSVTKTM
jgi:hypothetical protein